MARQPMYQQIADDLRRQIEDGMLERGSKLPTELELREKYDASRNTVRDAIRRLMELHLAETIPGKGTFVTKVLEPLITDLSPQTDEGGEEGQTYPTMVKERDRLGEADPPRIAPLKCPPVIASLLGISQNEEVISRGQDRYIDGELWSVQTSYYPRKWHEEKGADLLLKVEDIPQGTIRYLSSLGLKEVRYEDWITVRPAKEDEPQRFGVPHNAAMFLIYRTGFTEHGTAIRVTVTLYPADRNQFRYHSPRLALAGGGDCGAG
jgi:GntR family transcriptional regulator